MIASLGEFIKIEGKGTKQKRDNAQKRKPEGGIFLPIAVSQGKEDSRGQGKSAANSHEKVEEGAGLLGRCAYGNREERQGQEQEQAEGAAGRKQEQAEGPPGRKQGRIEDPLEQGRIEDPLRKVNGALRNDWAIWVNCCTCPWGTLISI